MLGVAIVPRWVVVMRGGKKPLVVLLTSSIAEVVGAAPVALIPTWAKVTWTKSVNARNMAVFFIFLDSKNTILSIQVISYF
jgi:hypothetical protein